jgi:RHH-type proline utilization regulon transcriptional repressor/proline dehydrogenase/delta 1-pyrroline-5-carboxylate dehydrogenase
MRVIECVSCTNLVVAVQAYQKRALGVLKHLNDLGQPLGIRLVKGAYWDTEIKMAQERGLEYPVFTSKENTNISYLACAKYLLESENLTPKFATHNPSTVAAVLSLTGEKLEFQRLYGMGNKLHKAIKKQGHTSRTYKPVGSATDLLAYLIRRMMENGANSSFVMHNQPEDHRTPGEPRDSYTKMYDRPNSPGLDTSDPESLNRLRRHINENSNP